MNGQRAITGDTAEALQIEPELRAGPEKVRQTQAAYRITSSSADLEAHSPLVVDADAVLAPSVPFESLQTVSRPGQIGERRCRVELRQLVCCGSLNSKEGSNPYTGGEVSRPLVPIADDHSAARKR
jgi:hypothetical protein